MNLFDLVAVEFGDTATSARPVDFVFDDGGNPIRIMKLVTTCPHCGALNEVDATGMEITEDSVINLRCTQCSKGQDDFDKFLSSLPDAPTQPEQPRPSTMTQTAIKTIEVDTERAMGCNTIPGQRHMIKPTGKVAVTLDNNGSFAPTSTFVDPIALGLFSVEDL